ncbi:MAG: exodeoxyribonuclease VII large subunit, partial [Pseudomonadota bacterium]
MDDLIDDPRPGRNEAEFTVSEISGAVKRALEDKFGRIRVKGEVGRMFRARSGHLYYDIKDDRNVLACTTWKGQISQLSIQPEEGMEVVVTGRLSAFGAQSKYNLNVDEMQIAGQGALMAMLEKRRAALAAEGLFEADRKRPLPFLPNVIGVITSPQGAVIRDILHRLADRFPREVLVWPVAVQGKACAPEVANAIRGFNALPAAGPIPRPDLLIVARGGGSIEDLWGFNEEAVVRAAADSQIPLISAVGHETDTTLIDHASDRRAPTPTAAAEMAVPVRAELVATVRSLGQRQTRAVVAHVTGRRQRLQDVARALPRVQSLLDRPRARLEQGAFRLGGALQNGVDRARRRLDGVAHGLSLDRALATRRGRLDGLVSGLARKLSRGFPEARRQVAGLSTRLRPEVLGRRLDQDRARLQRASAQLGQLARTQQQTRKDRLAALDRLRESLGYERTLERGFAVIRKGPSVLTTADAVRAAGQVQIQFTGD